MLIGNTKRNDKIDKIYYTLGVFGGIGMLMGFVYFKFIH